MPQTKIPGFGLNYDWDAGVDGWKAGMDQNMVLLNAWALPVAIAQQNAPPGSPDANDTYIVGAAGTGLFSGHDNELAVWDDNNSVWVFAAPQPDWIVYNSGLGSQVKWSGSAWVAFGGGGATPLIPTTTGSSSAYVVNLSETWVTNKAYQLNFHVTNAKACTVSDGTTAYTLKTRDGYSMATGVIGGVLSVTYNGTDLVLVDYTPSLLVESEVTGSDVTTVTFTGLDMNTHKSYRIEIEHSPDASSSTAVAMYANSDITATNYYSQFHLADGSTPSSGRGNDAVILSSDANSRGIAEIKLMYGTALYVIAKSETNRGIGVNLESVKWLWAKSAPVTTNLTRLDFTASVASGLRVGTKIRIYRGDV